MHDSEPRSPAEPQNASEATVAETIPKHTTPTWESELLLSGASVFGLLQFPSYLYTLLDRLHHQLSTTWDLLLELGSIFLLGIVYALIVTFLLHLATRAYWVALVGLRSVYPQGIRWERSRGGPINRRVRQAQYGDMDALIERADNRSTLIFATGIAIVCNSLVALLMSMPLLALAIVLQTWVWPLAQPLSWFMILMAALVVPFALPRAIDSLLGQRLAPDSGMARTLECMLSWGQAWRPEHVSEPLMLGLTTNIRHRRGFVWFLILIYALFFITSELEKMRHKGFDALPASLLARSLPMQQLADYYESAGTPTQLVPHIQADIVTDPYLRLWVPLDPHRTKAFERACSGARAAGAPANACLGELFAPSLDGHRLTGLDWHLYRDPSLDVDGLRAYVPVQSLSTGEHALRLSVPARDDPEPDAKPETWVIPFWR
ncbi:MAG TPA: hypothetical protein VGH80_10360 [Xanthomonadaceae bacterium]|jgi:hypothetical protein